jgi:hypothetical protein
MVVGEVQDKRSLSWRERIDYERAAKHIQEFALR